MATFEKTEYLFPDEKEEAEKSATALLKDDDIEIEIVDNTHRYFCFSLYPIGFIGSVISKKKATAAKIAVLISRPVVISPGAP